MRVGGLDSPEISAIGLIFSVLLGAFIGGCIMIKPMTQFYESITFLDSMDEFFETHKGYLGCLDNLS